jgi:hypothetical protein
MTPMEPTTWRFGLSGMGVPRQTVSDVALVAEVVLTGPRPRVLGADAISMALRAVKAVAEVVLMALRAVKVDAEVVLMARRPMAPAADAISTAHPEVKVVVADRVLRVDERWVVLKASEVRVDNRGRMVDRELVDEDRTVLVSVVVLVEVGLVRDKVVGAEDRVVRTAIVFIRREDPRDRWLLCTRTCTGSSTSWTGCSS